MALKDLIVRGPGPTGKPPRMIVKKEKPVPRQYKKGLRLDPVMINSDNWFYDTKRGLLFGPGEHVVLRTGDGNAVFVWRKYIDDTQPPQTGIECSLFRNEGPIPSSELIRQADAIADRCWAGERHYTKVNPGAVRSSNPGFCFMAAGWRRCGMTKGGLLILEKVASDVDVESTGL